MDAFLEITLYIIAMAFTPGPNVILAMVNAAQKKFPKCMTLNLGMFLGGFLVHTLVYFMISFLVKYVPLLRTPLQVLGILYILYLAWCMYRKGELKIPGTGGDFSAGFALQFMNVKVMMLGVTVNSVYIIPLGLPLLKGYLYIPYLCLLCLASTTVWAIAGTILSSWYAKYKKAFNISFALMLLALAIKSVLSL